MLINTVYSLLFLGIIALIKFRYKFDRVIVPLITLAATYIFYLFFTDFRIGAESVKTLLWDSSRSGDIKIDIISSPTTYGLILPFFIITLIALFNNLLFKFEQHKKSFAAILIFNLISLIMLIAGNNLIQIITFVFVIDILSQLLIKDIYASRRYSIYNLIADMGLFLVMAMLKSKLETLEVGNITNYYQTGRHRDFIMFVIVISLFIKLGFFLFQSYLLDLKNTKFHRLILIPYLSTPMVALILFMKFYPLLIISPSFNLCINIAVSLTMIWGAIGMVVINNLKEKTVYLNMLIISLLVKMIQSTNFAWNEHLSLLLIIGFCLSLCLYYAHYSMNRESNLFLVASSSVCNKNMFFLVMVIFMVCAASFCCVASTMINYDNMHWVYLFFILLPLCTSHIFAQILSVASKTDAASKTEIYPIMILLSCFIASCFVLHKYNGVLIYSVYFCVTYLLFLKLYPLKFVYNDKQLNVKLQKIDFFAHIYDVLIVNPIKIMGRWLTVLFDFMFIEKTVSSLFSSLNNFTIRFFRKAARHWVLYYVFNIILAVLIVLWCFFREN